MKPNPAGSDAWVQQARSVPIERELARRGIKLRGHNERVGPCPKCGGLRPHRKRLHSRPAREGTSRR